MTAKRFQFSLKQLLIVISVVIAFIVAGLVLQDKYFTIKFHGKRVKHLLVQNRFLNNPLTHVVQSNETKIRNLIDYIESKENNIVHPDNLLLTPYTLLVVTEGDKTTYFTFFNDEHVIRLYCQISDTEPAWGVTGYFPDKISTDCFEIDREKTEGVLKLIQDNQQP
jgi:hypothetical protein